MKLTAGFVMGALLAGAAVAAEPGYPLRLPAPGGEVILPDADSKANHDEWRLQPCAVSATCCTSRA
jgi:hypothetical protein